MTFRPSYALATIAVLGIEIVIARFVHDDFIRPYLGDSIAVVLVYLALRAATQSRMVVAVTIAFAFACAIEVGQFFHLVDVLGLGANRVARIVLGTTFGLTDFVAYVGGAAFVLAIEAARPKRLLSQRRFSQ
ncbi:MAG: DUF2809 domain-containing protein [Sphingomonas sp.]